MTFPSILERILERQDLGQSESEELMGSILRGELNDAQIAGLLIALKVKGASPTELAGFALAMRESATRLVSKFPNLVDTCGTGGGPATFNLSTGAAIVAAAAGAKVAKHGNRAVTSKCGSADVLEALGVRLDITPPRQEEVLEKAGIVFLFAPTHHPAMRHVGPARKALGVRTVFNQLGPLANPARASRQLIGVYDRSLLKPMAEALRLLGTERAFVVHSEEGMDEISPCGKTYAIEVSGDKLTERVFVPKTFKIEPVSFNEIVAGGSVEEAASALTEALTDPQSPKARALIPNSSIALLLAGIVGDPIEGANRARKAIEDGSALNTLKEMVKWTS